MESKYAELEYSMVPAALIPLISQIDAMRAMLEEQKEKNGQLFSDLQRSALISSMKRESMERLKAAGLKGYCRTMDLVQRGTGEYDFHVECLFELYKKMTCTGECSGRLKDDETVRKSVEQLCESYHDVKGNQNVHPLLLIPNVIYDLLRAVPLFEQWNEELIEITAQMLLMENGYDVGRYAQKERDELKTVLRQSVTLLAERDATDRRMVAVFMENFLQWLYICYKKSDERITRLKDIRLTKKGRIQAVIMGSELPLTKSDICQSLPDVSESTVEAHLLEMQRLKLINMRGSRRNAVYVRNPKNMHGSENNGR